MKRFTTLCFYLFPLLLTLALIVSLLESYKYIGFFGTHFFIPSPYIYILLLVDFFILVLQKDLLRKIKELKFYQQFIRVTTLIFVLIFIIFMVFSLLDVMYYKNFSFAEFHFQPLNLTFSLILLSTSVILFLISNQVTSKLKIYLSKTVSKEFLVIYNAVFFSDEKDVKLLWSKLSNHLKSNLFSNKKSSGPGGLKILLLTSAILLLTGYGFYNLIVDIKGLLDNDAYTASHLEDTYNQKMEAQWGLLYHMVEVIDNVTPDGSRILFPPFISPWSVAGNINQFRYFLGSRILINATDTISINGNPDYILIAKGGLHAIYDVVKSPDEYGWPKVFIPATKIWYVDYYSGKVIEVNKDFNPNEPFNKTAWGLIEVDKTRVVTRTE